LIALKVWNNGLVLFISIIISVAVLAIAQAERAKRAVRNYLVFDGFLHESKA
jgi:hypothetical protein